MRRGASLCAITCLLLTRAAWAQVDPFEFEVYPAQTLGKGMVEIESLDSFVAKGRHQGDEGTSSGDFPSDRMFRTALEVTYGLTDHIEAAAYLNLVHPNGESLQYAGSKYRLRGSLFEPGQLPVDLGWYAELEWNKTPQVDAEDLELELKPIVSKNFRRFQLALNPKFVKVLVGPGRSEGFEFGYVVGAYYNYLRWLSPGLELYGGAGLIDNTDPLHEQQHYIFPVVRGEFPHGIEYNFGVGVGLTRGSDQIITKLNIEFEHFLGTLF
jgi:hypothetical protein